MAYWCITEMIVVFAQVGASSLFLLLRYMKRETVSLNSVKIDVTTNIDYIDAVSIVAAYFKAILTPTIATGALLVFLKSEI